METAEKLEEYLERNWGIRPVQMVDYVLAVKSHQPDKARSLFERWLARDPGVHHSDFSGRINECLAAWIVEWHLRAGTLLPFCASELAVVGYQFTPQELNHPHLFPLIDTGWPYISRIEAVPTKLWQRADCVPVMFARAQKPAEIFAAWLAYLQTLHFWWQGAWKPSDPTAVTTHHEALWQACETQSDLRKVVLDFMLTGYHLLDCRVQPNYWQWQQFRACLQLPPGLARLSSDDRAYLMTEIRNNHWQLDIIQHLRREIPELLSFLGVAIA